MGEKDDEMARVVNVGKRDRMVAHEILHPGDSKAVSTKMAQQYEGDPELKVEIPGVIEEMPGEPGVAVQMSGEAQVKDSNGKWVDVTLPAVEEKSEISPSPQPSPAGRGSRKRVRKS